MRYLKQLTLIALLACLFADAGAYDQNPYQTREFAYERSWNFDDYKITTKGKVDFNYDYTDVIMMGEKAYLKIAKVSKGMTKKLHIGTKDGEILYRYFENNKELNFDSNGKEWMNAILPVVVRNTGLDLENRVKRIYADKGLTGFLAEFDHVSNEYFKERMVDHLLTKQKLSNSELFQLINHFSSNLKEQNTLGNILQMHSQKFLKTEELSKVYFTALESLPTSGELSRVMYFIFENNNLADTNYDRFLNLIAGMKPGKNREYHDKSSLVRLLLNDESIDNKKLTKVLSLVDANYKGLERSQLLTSALDVENISNENLKTIYLFAKSTSDYEKQSIFQKVLRDELLNPTNYPQFKEALKTISEDQTLSMLLTQLVEYQKIGDKKLDDVLELADNFSSNRDKVGFYNKLFYSMDLQDYQQLKILKKMENVDNQHELTMFLQEAVQSVNLGNEEIKEKLTELVNKIKEKHQYGMLMRSINQY